MTDNTIVIHASGIKNCFGDLWVHQGVNLSVHQQEIVALVGGSGSGKTTLLRNMLMLHKPAGGRVEIFGVDVHSCTIKQARSIQQRWGVTFQQGALFSSLTVLENIIFPLREFTDLSAAMMREIALFKLDLVGLPLTAAQKLPSQLSGGMIKRAALARAIVLDPELLFLDEPTAGLDPHSARAFDQLITQLRDDLGLTVMIITHDMDTIKSTPDRIAFLGEGRVIAALPFDALKKQSHPLIQDYFL